MRIIKRTSIIYPEMNQAERQELFEKVMGEQRKGYDYDIVEEKLKGKGRLLVYLREDPMKGKPNQERNAIVLGYRRTPILFGGRKIDLIVERPKRKSIETTLEKARIKVLNFLE